MEFARPQWLWLLLAPPILAAVVVLAARRRRETWQRLAQVGGPPGDGGRAWLVAIGMLVLAMAQPRWGQGPRTPLPPGRDIVFAVDVSWSMAAEDVVPNRLGRAIEAAEGLTRAVGQEPGDRVAVVAFAGRGVVRCPLTTNLGAAVEALQSLQPGSVEPGGTNLDGAIVASLDTLGDDPREGGRVIVILSDGEDHVPRWERRVDRLRALGVVVHGIAIGDLDRGHPIPIGAAGEGGRPSLLDPDGELVESRREDADLRGLALASGGAFVPIGLASADLAALYDERIAPVERQAREEFQRPERGEQFRLFILIALVVGLVGSWPRRRPAERRRPWWTSWLVVIGASSIGMVGAGRGDSRSAAEAVAEGRAAFARGAFDEALAQFDRAETLALNDPIPSYNAGATLYRIGRFGEARERYLASRERADEGLLLKIDYALGNTAVALRGLPEALAHYDACLASTVPGEASDRVRAFARENRAFAIEQIEEQAASLASEPTDSPSGGPGEGDAEPTGDDASSDPERPGAPGQSGGGGSPDDSNRSSDPTNPTGISAVSGSGTGSGQLPPDRPPADQLSNAVDAIRSARERRFPDLPRSPPPPLDRPNW